MVPAVVVFAVLAGVGLMAVPRKQALLEPLQVFNEAMGRVGSLLARLTPLGIFAIAGHTAGTMQLEEFERLQGFVLTYAVFACLLTFWLLPGLVAALDADQPPAHDRARAGRARDRLRHLEPVRRAPDPRRALAHAARGATPRTAPGTASGRTSSSTCSCRRPSTSRHGAKVLSIGFVLFAGWYAGVDVPAARYPALAGAGLLAVFGSINTAIPFLLDLVRVPADLFQLFVVSGVLNSRFGAMASAMHTLVVARARHLPGHRPRRLRRRELLRYLLVSALLVAAAVLGTRGILARVLPDPRGGAELLAASRRARPLAPATLLRTPPAPPSRARSAERASRRSCASGRLRVGFDDDRSPWAYVNAKGEVGGLRRRDGPHARPPAGRAARVRAPRARALARRR